MYITILIHTDLELFIQRLSTLIPSSKIINTDNLAKRKTQLAGWRFYIPIFDQGFHAVHVYVRCKKM